MRLLSTHFHAHVVTFDCSGFADSSGTPCEKTLFADANQILQWACDRVADDADIIVYGQSLGTFPAVDLASQLSQQTLPESKYHVDALVLDAAPASLFSLALSHPVGFPLRILPRRRKILRCFLRERLNSHGKMANVNMPVLVLHGERDWIVPVAQSRALYNAAVQGGNTTAEFVVVPRCGHSNVNASSSLGVLLNKFLQKHLKNPVPRRF